MVNREKTTVNAVTKHQLRRMLRVAFYTTTLGLLGAHMAGYHIARDADKTDEVSERLNISRPTMKSAAESDFVVLYPRHAKTELFFALTITPDIRRDDFFGTISESFNAAVYQNKWLGYGSSGDRLTRGISGKIMPCIVVFPEHSFTTHDIRESFAGFSKTFLHIPGHADEYTRLMLFHELEHCRHIGTGISDAMKEYMADQIGIKNYLANAGRMDVARTWIYMRALDATIQSLFGVDLTDQKQTHYIMAPLLHDHYIRGVKHGDVTQADLVAIQAAYMELRGILGPAAHKLGMNGLAALIDHPSLKKVVEAVLTDPNAPPMSPLARKLLDINREAYQYLTRPAPLPKAPFSIGKS